MARTTPTKPMPSTMRATNRTISCDAPAPIMLPSAMAIIPPVSERRMPSRLTTTPAPMPVIAPSVAKVPTTKPARSRPSERSLRINGMVMMALPIWAEATMPLPMSSSTLRAPRARRLSRTRASERVRVCGKPDVGHWRSHEFASGWHRRVAAGSRCFRDRYSRASNHGRMPCIMGVMA